MEKGKPKGELGSEEIQLALVDAQQRIYRQGREGFPKYIQLWPSPDCLGLSDNNNGWTPDQYKLMVEQVDFVFGTNLAKELNLDRDIPSAEGTEIKELRGNVAGVSFYLYNGKRWPEMPPVYMGPSGYLEDFQKTLAD
jgi:hypothetical protein